MANSGEPEKQKGFTVFLTGLPGAGKSTTAQALFEQLAGLFDRPVTLLDGDVVRNLLSPGLGFSKEHRDIHIRRLAFAASEITRNGGVCVCAAIAPYDAARKEARAIIEQQGGFILVHVATPAAVCESRDPKGLYARARAGTLPNFTGVCDPYESPNDANLVIDTSTMTREAAVQTIVDYLTANNYL